MQTKSRGWIAPESEAAEDELSDAIGKQIFVSCRQLYTETGYTSH